MPRFRLLAGTHSEPGPKTPDGQPTFIDYKPGDVFDSPTDLKAKFDLCPGVAPHFERVYDQAPVGPAETPEQRLARLEAELAEAKKVVATKPGVPPVKGHDVMPTLEAMKVDELKAWAAEEEIDLKGAKTRDDMLKTIKAALS